MKNTLLKSVQMNLDNTLLKLGATEPEEYTVKVHF